MESSKLVVHGFETSNNIKVRIALGYKGLDYDFRTIDPSQRDEVVRISGQHLTPVLQHGNTVLFDSAAIQRYLDANFPGTPKLFGASRDEQWEIEDWEFFARTQLAGPMLEVVHAKIGGQPLGVEAAARCNAQFASATRAIAERMQGRDWLVGSALSAADIAAVAVLFRIRTSGMLDYPEQAGALADWCERVLAFDRGA